MSNNTTLLNDAVNNGNLSPDALVAMNNIPDLGLALQHAMGVNIDDINSSEITLVAMLIDDSSSIRSGGNERIVCDGHNMVIESIKDSKQKNGVLILTKYLNGKVLCPWAPIDQAVIMDSQNYHANGSTPLYDQTVEFLALIAAKTEEFEQMAGVPVRSISLIISDGADYGSYTQKPHNVSAVVKSMLKSEKHIIAAMGIDDGSTDFKKIFSSMGLEDSWILTPGNSEKEIRASFRMFSQSAVRASQSGAGFSKTAMGGFGN